CAHPVYQVFGGLNVISDPLFPESEVQITVVMIDIVFDPTAVKVFHLAFMCGRAPRFAISFAHLSSSISTFECNGCTSNMNPPVVLIVADEQFPLRFHHRFCASLPARLSVLL